MNQGLTPRGLERRLKRHLTRQPQQFFAPCAPGFETVLQTELAALPDIHIDMSERGGVAFSGPLDTLYHANLELRTAHRVLLRIDDFLAQRYPMLFDHARRVPWELYLGFNDSVSFRVSARESRLRHKDKLTDTVYSAVLARLNPLGLSPVQRSDATTEIHLRLYQDRCTLSLNTSGEHLHKRGYRQEVADAPLRETLAASILLGQSLNDYALIYDPMCGTGSLLIEAALIATQRAPGLDRPFAFEQFPFYQASKWARFKQTARDRAQITKLGFEGGDLNSKHIRSAQANAQRAGVAGLIRFSVADTRTLTLSTKTLLVSNVPYGERLGSKQGVRKLLNDFAAQLESQIADFAFITKATDWLERPGIHIQSRLRFRNGGLPVYLVCGQFGA